MPRFCRASPLAAALTALAAAGAALGVAFTPLPDADILEPSIENEVNHALARAYAATNAVPTPPLVGASAGATNAIRAIVHPGMTNSDAAIRLVSAQKADGRWYDGTNDVTLAAIDALEKLLDANSNFQ